jgi:RNA polymerase sigma-70 factor (ECF subfamily)
LIAVEYTTTILDEMFQEHQHLILRTAYSLTHVQQDAEDVLQTIFLRLLQREIPLGLRVNSKAYLYRAAVNLSLNTIRSWKRRRVSDDIELIHDSVPVSEAGPLEDLQYRLRSAIAQLEPRVGWILMLRYEHNFSDAEIANMIGKSRGAVAVILHRTRTHLKEILNVAN